VLPGVVEFFLKRLCSEHRITIPLEHIRLLSGSLHDILQKAIIIIRVLKSGGFRLLNGTVTYLHPCSARRIDSKLRATIAGLIRSSARSSSPSRLVAAASDIGAEQIGSTS
jgi:hypothetical protein